MTVNVAVRDSRGTPLEIAALVRLYSMAENYNVQAPTQEGSTAVFRRVVQGEYEVEVKCAGFKPKTEQVSVMGFGGDFNTFIYIERENEAGLTHRAPTGIVMSPKLLNEIQKGLEAMRKREYETARTHFLKATQLGPTSSDAAYLLGTAELSLKHTAEARREFEEALRLEASHERALLALGEMQLNAGETREAIGTLERAYLVNGASWRTHLLLALAYARAGEFPEAEKHAERAAVLAKENGAYALFLLGEIENAEGKREEARSTWQEVSQRFPDSPMAAQAKEKLARIGSRQQEGPAESTAALPQAALPVTLPAAVIETAWAPPDIDSKEYAVAPNAGCKANELLAQGRHRMRTQIGNFEKFVATERIEHQEIDRNGVPGPVRAREFSYLAFVHKLEDGSIYVEESRNGGSDLAGFPTSLATRGLNSLGVLALQPTPQNGLTFQCEGVATLRGQTAWLIRFEEKKNPELSIREWRKGGTTYEIRVKGRLWVSTASYDLIRIETDLQEPIAALELNRDHIVVDYGPVTFEAGKTKLWLPWSAEVYMELHGRRYHHRHFLTDYLFFAVDTVHRLGKPAGAPPDGATPLPE